MSLKPSVNDGHVYALSFDLLQPMFLMKILFQVALTIALTCVHSPWHFSWQMSYFLVILQSTSFKQYQWMVKLLRNKMPYELLSKSVKSFYITIRPLSGRPTARFPVCPVMCWGGGWGLYGDVNRFENVREDQG